MTTICGVAEAALYVDDLTSATRFYTEVLGLSLTAAFADARFLQTGRDSTLILFDRARLRARESVIPAHGATGPTHVALAVPRQEMEAWRERLGKHGVPIEHEQTWPQGTHSIYFRDPAGNSLELIEDGHYRALWERLQQQ
jgi:catechol 2,3-dioxygenase-like lactoylglutathione lyase family enzyme